ncbi:MAG: 30S ribosomal protein S17e [Candidatus Woesearchaeota archaeon]
MGRIKTKKIKRNTQKIYSEINDKLSANFKENKEVIQQKYTILSKKLRNIIAGYSTRLKRSDTQ